MFLFQIWAYRLQRALYCCLCGELCAPSAHTANLPTLKGHAERLSLLPRGGSQPGLWVQLSDGSRPFSLALDIQVHRVITSKGFLFTIIFLIYTLNKHLPSIYTEVVAYLFASGSRVATKIFKTCVLTFFYNLPFSLGSSSQG